ncbi:uncharacterized protein LOC134216661 [Armigeres subalbatus]|uniref:uncharacterized protein LOC134216661 n=1 Tax=Armigeres subalbatus TaxID=124917 RepID=UPI002ED1EE9A
MGTSILCLNQTVSFGHFQAEKNVAPQEPSEGDVSRDFQYEFDGTQEVMMIIDMPQKYRMRCDHGRNKRLLFSTFIKVAIARRKDRANTIHPTVGNTQREAATSEDNSKQPPCDMDRHENLEKQRLEYQRHLKASRLMNMANLRKTQSVQRTLGNARNQ